MKSRFLFFCKAPKPGYAKSRLAPFLGNSTAAELSAALTEYVLEQLLQHFYSVNTELCFVVCYTGEEDISYWHSWFLPIFTQYFGKASQNDSGNFSFEKNFQLSFVEQSNGSLGDRLRHAFYKSFETGAKKVIVVGIDSPDLDGFLVETALKALETFDVVVGPCLDGGYYLLGMRSFCEEVFTDIPWSTSKVLHATRNQALNAGYTMDVLPALEDIDEVENLFILERLAATTNKGKRWIKFLAKWLLEYLHPYPSYSYCNEALNSKSQEETLLASVRPRWVGESSYSKSHPIEKSTESKPINNVGSEVDAILVYVSVVKPQLVGKLLRVLGKVLPLGKELSHVKRVKRDFSRSSLDQDGKRHRSEPLITVLLCLKEDFESLDCSVLESLNEFGLEPFVMSVPSRAAITREEYVSLCPIWPVLYQPLPPPRPLPSNEEMLFIMHHMRICFDIAWHHRKNSNYLGICAMMVRPSNNEIITVTCDTSCRSHLSDKRKEKKCERCQPFTHAVMNCIESASWKVGSHKRRQILQNKTLSDCSYICDDSEISLTGDSDSHSFESETDTETTDKSLLPDDAYMCTGMDVYTTREPCLMCCMALVHARVKRVIFAIPNKYFGGLGGGPSGTQLHKVTALNHHFDVLHLEGFEKIWKPTERGIILNGH
ncbi:Probable inactive tRNA-specific adenosine deaminase-like protein 3 [Galdieria sulphuraria]|uniref:CMP/dCMP-type deaminase domain-containing protein n=1 Tax=Galdieria sulphuraria TaxID=130081 RepID=M2X4L5_GALSU|nr:uncharacterized protein Gasu_13300 [Galdieria sulphuraria]EME31365.1 hypothetical protein Gasu_13300 [Galdieria sulphuraria]GJD07246.1 Probable inactive tRNA-specific adenosine deaminase-like protein 3 [Galdieria sulphuraria]|eukprot:XP_005707885.1 hypothetical protein Gasu_13300 [Galdieria sulphuraria]